MLGTVARRPHPLPYFAAVLVGLDSDALDIHLSRRLALVVEGFPLLVETPRLFPRQGVFSNSRNPRRVKSALNNG